MIVPRVDCFLPHLSSGIRVVLGDPERIDL
jgi:hypothetical protein